jgi:hypothetical protein
MPIFQIILRELYIPQIHLLLGGIENMWRLEFNEFSCSVGLTWIAIVLRFSRKHIPRRTCQSERWVLLIHFRYTVFHGGIFVYDPTLVLRIPNCRVMTMLRRKNISNHCTNWLYKNDANKCIGHMSQYLRWSKNNLL